MHELFVSLFFICALSLTYNTFLKNLFQLKHATQSVEISFIAPAIFWGIFYFFYNFPQV